MASAASALPAASSAQVATTPAQIVAMAAAPKDGSHHPEEGSAPTAAGAATALAADSLSERPTADTTVTPATPVAARKATPKKSGVKTATAKKGADAGNSGAKPRAKSARQHTEPDPDADVVAAIMAGMDRQAAAAAKSAQAASQPGARRP